MRQRTPAVLQSVCHQLTASITHCRPTVQPPQSYSVGGQRSSGQLIGKPAGVRPDLADLVPPPLVLSQMCASPWELLSTTGSGIAWTRTSEIQAIGRILHSTRSDFTRCNTREPMHPVVFYIPLRPCAPREAGSLSCPFLGIKQQKVEEETPVQVIGGLRANGEALGSSFPPGKCPHRVAARTFSTACPVCPFGVLGGYECRLAAGFALN
ncbi:UNVERIFIED_CONTAM: hypothetical protein FKN15_027405 [Acipenser sinensis]